MPHTCLTVIIFVCKHALWRKDQILTSYIRRKCQNTDTNVIGWQIREDYYKVEKDEQPWLELDWYCGCQFHAKQWMMLAQQIVFQNDEPPSNERESGTIVILHFDRTEVNLHCVTYCTRTARESAPPRRNLVQIIKRQGKSEAWRVQSVAMEWTDWKKVIK